MSNKKIFFVIRSLLICSTLFLPIQSFSEINNNNRPFGLYIAGQYKPSISYFTNFSIKETHVQPKEILSLKNDVTSITTDVMKELGNFNVPYSATFQNNIAGFSGTVGCLTSEGPRVEIEGSYEKFDIKSPKNNKIEDAFRYFALTRNTKEEKITKHVVMRNNGISITSIVLNGCYDFSASKSRRISPYMCVGFGGDFIELFDSVRVKFAYQGKLGINYPLSSNIILFVDGYYHRVIGNQFKHLSVQHVIDLSINESKQFNGIQLRSVPKETSFPRATSAIATLTIKHFGGGFGLKFIF
ncbi:P44/Msp2 family outer membrane protein [Ehrlichia sp. JZT12]